MALSTACSAACGSVDADMTITCSFAVPQSLPHSGMHLTQAVHRPATITQSSDAACMHDRMLWYPWYMKVYHAGATHLLPDVAFTLQH